MELTLKGAEGGGAGGLGGSGTRLDLRLMSVFLRPSPGSTIYRMLGHEREWEKLGGYEKKEERERERDTFVIVVVCTVGSECGLSVIYFFSRSKEGVSFNGS